MIKMHCKSIIAHLGLFAFTCLVNAGYNAADSLPLKTRIIKKATIKYRHDSAEPIEEKTICKTEKHFNRNGGVVLVDHLSCKEKSLTREKYAYDDGRLILEEHYFDKDQLDYPVSITHGPEGTRLVQTYDGKGEQISIQVMMNQDKRAQHCRVAPLVQKRNQSKLHSVSQTPNVATSLYFRRLSAKGRMILYQRESLNCDENEVTYYGQRQPKVSKETYMWLTSTRRKTTFFERGNVVKTRIEIYDEKSNLSGEEIYDEKGVLSSASEFLHDSRGNLITHRIVNNLGKEIAINKYTYDQYGYSIREEAIEGGKAFEISNTINEYYE